MSKTCILPWLHFFVASTGKVTPCCIYDKPFTDLKDKKTVNEIVNSKEFKDLRLQMINGEENQGCNRCYNEERLGMFSDRLRHNDAWKQYSHLIEKTNKDGSVDDFKMKFLDVRWENTCNFKCRTCSPDLSSKISSDYFKLKWINKPVEVVDMNVVYDFVIANIQDIEEFYFVGGEPLLMSNHYNILDALIASKNFDARLTYSTNLSVLKYKDKSVIDYWKQMTNLLVMVSLDAMEERASYLRSGTNWTVLVDNIKLIKSIPHLQLKIASVFSFYNALHLVDLQKFLLTENIVTSDQLEINVAYGSEFCPKTLSKKGKQMVQDKVNDFLAWSKQNNFYSENLQVQWDRSLSYMLSEDIDRTANILQFNTELDKLRNENLLTVFPEIKDFLDIKNN